MSQTKTSRRDFLARASAALVAVTALASEAKGEGAEVTAAPDYPHKGTVGRIRIAHEEKGATLRKGDLALVDLTRRDGGPKDGQLVAAFTAEGKLVVRFYTAGDDGTVVLRRGPQSKRLQVFEPDAVMIFGPVFCVERGGGPYPVLLNLNDSPEWRPESRDPASLAADRLAAIIEDPTTPPVIRDGARDICHTIDAHTAPEVGHEVYDYLFDTVEEVEPDAVRLYLPARVREVADWQGTGFDIKRPK